MLSIGDKLDFDGQAGTVVAVTDTLDADGRGTILYGGSWSPKQDYPIGLLPFYEGIPCEGICWDWDCNCWRDVLGVADIEPLRAWLASTPMDYQDPPAGTLPAGARLVWSTNYQAAPLGSIVGVGPPHDVLPYCLHEGIIHSHRAPATRVANSNFTDVAPELGSMNYITDLFHLDAEIPSGVKCWVEPPPTGKFRFRVLQWSGGDPLSTSGADPFLRVGLVQRTDDATMFCLIFDDLPGASGWGRLVDGVGGTWASAASYAAEDSLTFVVGWAPGTITVQAGGVEVADAFADAVLTYATGDGEHTAWYGPAYPYNDLAVVDGVPLRGPNKLGCFKTDEAGVLHFRDPDGSLREIVFPRGLGALGNRAGDTWASAPTPERTLTGVDVWFQQEHAEIAEAQTTTLDLVAVSLTINGPVNATYRACLLDGWQTAVGTLDGAGTATVTGLPPGRYAVVLYSATQANGLPRQEVECTDSGGSYTITFPSSWTVTPTDKWQGIVYAHGATPAPGVNIMHLYEWEVEPGVWDSEWRVWATTDANGAFGPLPKPNGLSYCVMEHPTYGAAAIDPNDWTGALWWDPCLSGRLVGLKSAESGVEYQGLLPWGTAGPHENLNATTRMGYLWDPARSRRYEIHGSASGGYYSDPVPRWFLEANYQVPASDATITYQLYDIDGTYIAGGFKLVDDPAPHWALGYFWWKYNNEGERLVGIVGGKVNGVLLRYDPHTLTEDVLREPQRYGVETGKAGPTEARTSSAIVEAGEAGTSRFLAFCEAECPYCGGPVAGFRYVGLGYARGFCVQCADYGVSTDCRSYFATPTLAAVDDWLIEAVKNTTAGVHTGKVILGWPRPEEYDETDDYLVWNWQDLGVPRWVAVHLVLGTWNGAFVDGESIADAEARLGRTVGPVQLKLELLADYSGTGATVSVTATAAARRRPRMSTLPTVRAVVLRQCVRCLGLPSRRSGYDCLGQSCPLYAAMPWRGKRPPRSGQPSGPPQHEVERTAELARTHPKRRASKRMVAAQCRMCLPDGDRDCADAGCPLSPLRPFQPGGQPKNPNRVRASAGRRPPQRRESGQDGGPG